MCLQDAYHELEGKEMEVMAMMLNGEDMFVRCRDHEAQLLRHKLVQLKAGLNDTKAKADKIKVTPALACIPKVSSLLLFYILQLQLNNSFKINFCNIIYSRRFQEDGP